MRRFSCLARRETKQKKKRESYSEKTLLKFVKEHLQKYPSPRRGAVPQSNVETLGP
jgi:hypothetical protein